MNNLQQDATMTEETQETKSAGRVVKRIDRGYELALKIKDGEAGTFLYCLEDDKFYFYNNGYWESLFEVDFLGKIQEAMPELTYMAVGGRKNIAENFKMLARKRLDQFNWSEMINLKNGMLSPWNGELEPHDPLFYSTNRLPYIYDASAKCDLWIKTLMEIFENDKDKINILQEFFGYCLTRDTKQHKALLLLGESRSGKSTILQTLRYVVGVNNCSSVPIKYIANPQHTPMLINKLVNIDTDVSAKAAEFEAEFKTITSGEPVQTNQKYVSAFDFVPYCKIVMAANIFPKITDHSSAFYNRLILIPCDRVFSPEEQNRDLPKQLMGELSGVLNWAIEGLKRLVDRGKFEELDFMRDAVQELEDENNPINMFFEEHVLIDMGSLIDKATMFDKYKLWCEKTKNFTLSKARFASCLFKKYHKYTPKQCRRSDGNRAWVWKNLNYVEFKGTPEGVQVAWQE